MSQDGLEPIRGEIQVISLVGQLREDLGALIGKVLIDDVLGLRLAVHDAGRAFIPVIAFFPGSPEPLGIKAVQLVGTAADERVELEVDLVTFLFEDVLGHDPRAAPAVKEAGVEARIGLGKLEHDRIIIFGGDGFDVFLKEAAGGPLVIAHQRFDREDDIRGGEGLAVIPGNALAQRNFAGGEIGVVLRIAIGQAIDDLAGGEIDRPEGFVCQGLHTAVAVFPAHPLIEVVGGTAAPGQDIGDQSFAARERTQHISQLFLYDGRGCGCDLFNNFFGFDNCDRFGVTGGTGCEHDAASAGGQEFHEITATHFSGHCFLLEYLNDLLNAYLIRLRVKKDVNSFVIDGLLSCSMFRRYVVTMYQMVRLANVKSPMCKNP